MIPYVEQPAIRLGPITIYTFGILVALAVFIGLHLLRRRVSRQGLDPVIGEGLGWYALIGGLVGAHLLSVLFYFPSEVVENPLVLFKLWEDISSFGGIVGGLIGMYIFLAMKTPRLDAHTEWRYLDAAAFAFPFALAVGRLACTFAHDHPGSVTGFPLAISLESPEAREYVTRLYAQAGRVKELLPAGELAGQGFHDLGWYEFLYLAVIVVPATILLDREPRPDGTFLIAFVLLYVPVRFALDFLRVSDAHYWGLTPAQYLGVAAMALAMYLLWRRSARSRASVSSTGRARAGVVAPSPRVP